MRDRGRDARAGTRDTVEAAAAAGVGAALLGGSAFLAAGVAMVGVGALIGLAGGHVVGMIQGTFDD